MFGALGCGGGSTPTGPPPAPQLTLSCPSRIEAQSQDGNAVPVNFTLPSSSGGTAPVTVACTPPPGSLFPGGTTSVTCSATDSRGVRASCSVPVFVSIPPRLVGTGRVLAFGDSITAGTPGGGMFVPGAVDAGTETTPFAYPHVLDPLLVERYKTQSPIIYARGKPAEYAQQAIQRFQAEIALTRPDIVLLMEGTNDLLFGSAGAADAAVALRAMVQHAKSQKVLVMLSTVTPQRPDGPRNRALPAALVPVLNERIREIAATENVPLVDMYDVFIKDMTLIGQDDLHPTPRGFRVMAETFFEAIKQHGEVPHPTVGIVR